MARQHKKKLRAVKKETFLLAPYPPASLAPSILQETTRVDTAQLLGLGDRKLNILKGLVHFGVP
eukprot:8537582-Pyramimonas_sp.AAC.1